MNDGDNCTFLKKYGVMRNQFEMFNEKYIEASMEALFSIILGTYDNAEAFTIYLIEEVYGINNFAADFSIIRETTPEVIIQNYSYYRSKINDEDIKFNGAEAVVIMLHDFGVDTAVGYPGTSELSLCEAFDRYPHTTILNGRGDKESAFCAAGMNLYNDSRSICILHGARGLTNAGGAVADIRRNEISLLVVVGLPSTRSIDFLPPHGENNLIKGMGMFAKYGEEFRYQQLSRENAKQYLMGFQKCYCDTCLLPRGPVLLGIPQDILDNKWIPYRFLRQYKAASIQKAEQVLHSKIDMVCQLIVKCRQPLVLVDDFAFRKQIKDKIVCFSDLYQVPVLQLKYRRGPMFFEQLQENAGNYIFGYYDPDNPLHKQYMDNIDLLITVEDRNMYKRVAGVFPRCKKIAITSNSGMTIKNGYLTEEDIILDGEVEECFDRILERPIVSPIRSRLPNQIKMQLKHRLGKCNFLWNVISKRIGDFLNGQDEPILIDDSQMFGGVLSECYNNYPDSLKVFGDHGAFIGSGISYAAGVAYVADQNDYIVVTLGDQAFTNGFQGMLCAAEYHLKILYIVCNNGKSISLLKQTIFDHGLEGKDGIKVQLDEYLANLKSLDYCKTAAAFGINSYNIDFRDATEANINHVDMQLKNILCDVVVSQRAALLEFVVPSDFDVWEGVWSSKGLDQ